ncbi:hypothetical protein [Sneathia sanguinegens]|uniref:hypothetical protein n=1 Tax=Sneathia sanguinegens TaxID=40543 RepID=UPI0023F89F8A|nr:hypothetical protein [Sneathia sanguinegens]
MYSQGHDSGYNQTWSMWNTNLKFLKDGKYLIELTYVFYKVDDRRNPWDIDDNVFGSNGYISFNDNIIESNLDFVYRNGYYSGLIEEPTVNGNNKVPLIHKALIPVTVANGVCIIEDEHLQKTNVLMQDLTYKSTYINNKYEVKYISNNISFNWLINYKGINFNEYKKHGSDQFLYPNLDSNSTVNKGQFLLHLAIMCGWYDGTGNNNDWLMAFLLQYCIYPIPKDKETYQDWSILKELKTVFKKEEFLFKYSVEKWIDKYKNDKEFQEAYIKTKMCTNLKAFLEAVESLSKEYKDAFYERCINYLYELKKIIDEYRNSEEVKEAEKKEKIEQENEKLYEEYEEFRDLQEAYEHIMRETYGVGWTQKLQQFKIDHELDAEQLKTYLKLYNILKNYDGVEIRPLYNLLSTDSEAGEFFADPLLPYLKE